MPSVKIKKIDPRIDKFITIATDGVWRHLGPTEIGDIVYETHMEGIPGGCDDINDKIKTECAQENGKNLDDHTIIISALTTN